MVACGKKVVKVKFTPWSTEDQRKNAMDSFLELVTGVVSFDGENLIQTDWITWEMSENINYSPSDLRDLWDDTGVSSAFNKLDYRIKNPSPKVSGSDGWR